MKKVIKDFIRIFGIEIKKYKSSSYTRVVSLKPKGEPRGNVLVSYILEPFLMRSNQPVPNTHINFWRSLQIAQTFLDLGYCVDAIDFRNQTFVPNKNYSFFIDVRRNLERLSSLLNKDCIKILHIDTAHILFHNAAESLRLLDLQRRKGITLRPFRYEMPNLAIEHADFATITGNEFSISTFRYANKTIYNVPQSPCVLYDWLDDKNFEADKKNYLWLNSGGLVHKGLDLALDAFAEMPDHQLYICGPIEKEEDFVRAYYKELYETPNIHTIGWIDISSKVFDNMRNRCLGVICFSCSEVQSQSVITAMHAGLIPVVSYESGVDVHDFGVMLKDCSVESIIRSIKMLSSFPSQKLKMMAYKSWEFARAYHTKERFTEEYKKVILGIIEKCSNRKSYSD